MNHAADPAQREAQLDAMQDRLDWLREHKDAPLLHWGQEILYPADRSEVRAIAVATGETPEERGAYYRVTKHFGAGVTYVVFADGARDMVAAGGAR